MKTTTTSKWDNNSGVRERLALIAVKGPSIAPGDWGYHPSRDFWYQCGTSKSREIIKVAQEGTASLELIAKRHNLNRSESLTLIGYPEE